MGEFAVMATDEMRRYEPDSPDTLRELENQAFVIAQNANAVYESAREHFYFSLIQDIVESQYDIGKVLEVYQIFGGYINTTFGIYTEKDGERQTWLFRMYIKGKTLNALLFEHRLLQYCRANGFDMCAAPIENRKGSTYVTRDVDTGTGEGPKEYYFSIFNYIGGVQTYGWMPGLWQDGVQDITITSAAQCLAGLHSAAAGFDPQGIFGDNLLHIVEDFSVNEIIHRYPEIRAGYRKIYSEAGLDNNPYTNYYDAHIDFYEDACKRAFIPDDEYKDLFICPCHSDFHCDNLKYNTDGAVVGVFDFDSAKIDARIFDVCYAIHYLFSSWKSRINGELLLDRTLTFLKAYDAECVRIGKIPPITQAEKRNLYKEFLQATIFIDGWCTAAIVLDTTVDPYEYVYYSQHFVRATKWVEAHKDEIENLAKQL